MIKIKYTDIFGHSRPQTKEVNSMKGKILKRVVAAALALLIVSGGAPIKPVADMFGDTAITANAEEAWSKSAANTVLGTTGIEHPQAPQ